MHQSIKLEKILGLDCLIRGKKSLKVQKFFIFSHTKILSFAKGIKLSVDVDPISFN